ncbi:CaiB/BaiF CoA-transferase family protein [Salinirubellus sp. GCM10025818]|uniref:CaiB/BaiF CoA transferase family protein n=1 Tax=Salinirubellus TaxID=2162630 RepID=UPI0030D2403E
MRLDGVRVVDLTTLLPGPYGTQLLADLGADVVKVERVDAGDDARYTPPLTDEGHGALFDAVNRGKRSVALDLKDERGREALYELVSTADAFVEQFRPGVVDRLGVDYDTLREHNPGLVYCSLSGYGQSGPKSGKAAHDLNYIGLAGLLDMTRESEAAKPQMPGYPIADMAGGVFAAFSIVCALLSRELGAGESDGEYIDCSLTDPVLSFSQSVAPSAFMGEDPRPGETALTGGYPWYDVYECDDGRYVTLAALEPRFWRGFCEAVDREDLLGYHTTDDPAEMAALREELESLFASRTRDEWVEAVGDADATVDGVYTPAEALEHPQVEAMEIVEDSGDSLPRVGYPARGEGVPDGPLGGAPGHGEHTGELLREVGLSEARVDSLAEAGVAGVGR